MLLTHDQYVSLLKTNEIVVEFTKTDGTLRVMRCTLNPQQLPENSDKKRPITATPEKTSVSVWDLDAEGWRSFRLDSVHAVHVVTEGYDNGARSA